MQTARYNLVVDGQFGSTGKGLIAGYLAWKYRPEILGTTNGPNSGHTCVDVVGSEARSFVAKALPSPAILNAWYDDYNPLVVVGPSASFHLNRMLEEITACNLNPENLWIHKRAGVVTQAHREAEASPETGTKHLASTGQGGGAFLADKIMRRPGLKLAGDYEELKDYIGNNTNIQAIFLMNRLKNGATALHEGSQGFSLDINHGHSYPQCTSRQCTSAQCVADMGIAMKCIGDIYMVIRPYPIRVGNVVEDGKTVGFSGGHYPDQQEIDWQIVGTSAGMPQDEIDALNKRELTTVTKRLRRVFTFSEIQLREAAAINGATKIALNFSNYLDYNVYGVNTITGLTPKVFQFIERVEKVSGVKVALVGTGPRVDQVVEL